LVVLQQLLTTTLQPMHDNVDVVLAGHHAVHS
jgi:hypothetical protein